MIPLCRILPCVFIALVFAGCAGSSSKNRILTPVAMPPRAAAAEPARRPIPAPVVPPSSRPLVAQSPAPTSLPSPTPEVPPAPTPDPVVTPVPVPVPVPPGVTNPPAAAAVDGRARIRSMPALRTGQPWPVAWSNVWVPFETWARMNGLGMPVQLASGSNTAFTVGSPEGMIRLKIGNPAVHTGGHDSLLGYSPRLVGGIPYLHSLDIEKTLQPLVNGEFKLPATNRIVVIDPGHGGRDSGTLNGFGRENEKDFTLDWARRLEPLLVAAGWTVVLTRTNDVDVPLQDRVQIAEAARASLFLSLHFNAGGHNQAMNGIETYCLTPTGLPSSLRRDYEDDPRESYSNNAFDQENILLASRLHRAMLKTTGSTDRGVRRARFMTVLRGQNRPSVLMEGGYLSNPTEARRIATASYRQLLAEAVAQVLNERGHERPIGSSPATASASATSSAAANP